MKLFEYQAKERFEQAGIPVPKAVLIKNVEGVEQAAEAVGYPCVLKAQLLQGGRGKAGLITFADTSDKARSEAKRLFSSELGIKNILVEQAVAFRQEIYLAITADPLRSELLIMASAEGGVEIEELAAKAPEKILKEYVDLDTGLCTFQVNNICFALGVKKEVVSPLRKLIFNLYNLFHASDAELAEINPLFITEDDQVVAGDAKLSIDESSLFRQPGFTRTRDYFDSDMEFEAAELGIPYLQFDGDISLMCAGAGLTTTVFDLITYEGGTVANYLEFGGPNYRRALEAMKLCLRNQSKVILVVTFGTIARADVMAEGIVSAVKELKPDRPIVTCIRGTNEEEAVRILTEAGLEPLFDTEEAVRKAVKLSKGEQNP
jgi:succinyl-CoA synthetase beta subunit